VAPLSRYSPEYVDSEHGGFNPNTEFSLSISDIHMPAEYAGGHTLANLSVEKKAMTPL
jgi:hypothetical protein